MRRKRGHMAIDQREAELMIDDCFHREDQLTEWEINFVSSLYDKNKFTQKQLDTLEKIWDKVTNKF